jgi:hypothetical protein|tara:strand:+ start:536 stop:703 length:168 start_codon:yes stop_codon:yes gene_type:complete
MKKEIDIELIVLSLKYIQRNIDMSLWKEINPANQINYEKWEISRDIKTLINNLDK